MFVLKHKHADLKSVTLKLCNQDHHFTAKVFRLLQKLKGNRGIRFYVIPISDLGRASYISSVTCTFVYRLYSKFQRQELTLAMCQISWKKMVKSHLVDQLASIYRVPQGT